MTMFEAIEIVTDLARENIMSRQDAKENDLMEMRAKAVEACLTMDNLLALISAPGSKTDGME